MAITWRNVTGDTGHADASRMLTAAQNSLNAGFEGAVGLLDRRMQQIQDNREITSGLNTDNIQDFLAGFNSVEEFEAAKASGALNQQLAQYGNQYDRSAIRESIRGMPTQLREKALLEREYSDSVAEYESRPLVAQYRTLMAQGKYDEGNQLLADHDIPYEGKLALEGNDIRSANNERLYAANRDTRAGAAEIRAQAIARQNSEVFRRGTEAYNRGEKERKALLAADDLSQSMLIDIQQKTDTERARVRDVARANNIPVDENGDPDFSQIPAGPERDGAIDLFRSKVGDIYTPPSASQARKDFIDRLGSDSGLTSTQINAAADQFTSTLAGRNELAPEEQSLLDKLIAQRTAEYEYQIANDPFAQVDYEPEVEAARLLGFTTGENWDPDGVNYFVRSSKQKALIDAVTTHLSDGITLENGETYRVTPKIAELALMQAKDSGKVEDYNTAIKDLLSREGIPERMRAGENAATDFQSDIERIKEEVRARAGLPGRPLNYLDRALNRRLNQ